MPVKLDPIILDELREMNLTLWSSMHPKESFFNEKTGKQSQREDKSRVIVTIIGPGMEHPAMGFGGSLREAVDDALQYRFTDAKAKPLTDRVPGLRGALLRLEAATSALRLTTMYERHYVEQPEYDRSVAFGDDLDDDIPF